MGIHTPLDSSLVTAKAQTRAERRRLEREQAKGKATYTLTLDAMNEFKREVLKEADRQYNEHKKLFCERAIECVVTASVIALHDEFGFGEKRLKQYKDRMENLLECINTGNITYDELVETTNRLNEKAVYKPEIKNA